MGVFSGNQKDEPLHYGEVFAIWNYKMASDATFACYQTFMNHTGDAELHQFLEDMTQNVLPEEMKKTEEVLKMNGIALPPAPPERPLANLENIPPGARFNDAEISAAVGRDIATGLVACSQAIAQCIREDIALMFGQFHTTKATYGARLLRLNKQKGWVIPPPQHTNTAEPVQV